MVQEHVAGGSLTFSYEPQLATCQWIHAILKAARKTRLEGSVARHLVGASLQLAFPDFLLRNESCGAAHVDLRLADFHLGDTDFYVIVCPTPAVFETYKRRTEDDFRTFILVPDRFLAGAMANAQAVAPGCIAVYAIESFIGQSLDELAGFSKDRVIDGFRRLLETYNQRVDAVENDKSMLIEIPRNLLR